MLVTGALSAVVLTGIVVAMAASRAPAPSERFAGPLMPPGVHAANFTLLDQNGRRTRLSDYRGQALVISFMYSHCPDACPLMATEIRGALDELGSAGRTVPVLAISVDPAHDTRASATAFLARERMTGRMRFLLGTRRQLERTWRRYAVQPGKEHSAFVFLVDRAGLVRVGFPASQLIPEDLAHDLRLLLDERGAER